MKKVQFLVIQVLLLLLSSSYTPNTAIPNLFEKDSTYEKNTDYLKLTPNYIEVNQDGPITSSSLFADIVSLLLQERNEVGSWNLTSLIEEQIVYNGIRGGIAGIGLQFLESRATDVSFVNETMDNILLNLAEDVAFNLEANAIDINATHAVWEVSDLHDIIDPGFDFGLAGISYFYSKLYNQTQDDSYRILAQKTLQSIGDLVNSTNGLHFKSKINPLLSSISWYNPLEFDFLGDLGEITFSGIAFGTAGIARAALTYLRDTNDNSDPLAQSLIDQSFNYLSNQTVRIGSQSSMPMAEEFEILTGTNFANGMVGIADLYLDLFQFTDNSTYETEMNSIVNWLNANSTDPLENDTQRMFIGYEFNGTVDQAFEFGLSHGLAGISSFFLKYFQSTGNQTYLIFANNIMSFMNPFRIEDDSQIHYAERVIGGIRRQVESNSKLFGTTGIYEVLYQLWTELGTDLLEQSVVKTKNFLLSEIVEKNGYYGMTTDFSGNLENNPSIGLPSFLLMLTLRAAGKLLVEKDALVFDEVEIGTTAEIDVELKNFGESTIDVTWNFLTGTEFGATGSPVMVGDQETVKLSIQFTPSSETDFIDEITLISGEDGYVVSLLGKGFDIPELTTTSTRDNNTVIEGSQQLTFSIQVVDSSVIDQLSISIDQGSSQKIAPDAPGGNDYQYSLSTSSLSNGSHSLIFSATDISGHTGQVLYNYIVKHEETPLEEKIFSDENLFILGSIIVVLIITAIIVTRRYMS